MNYKVLLISLLPLLRAEATFENSSNLCTDRCSCTSSEDKLTLSIDCSNRHMKHTIANWPEHPKRLMATFRNNSIVTLEKMPGTGAEDIKLIFSNCGIKYLETGLFESAVNIKFLDLSYNYLNREQLTADVFKGPYNVTLYEPIALEHLDLSYNQIHSLQKNIFEHTPHLKVLNLEGNFLRIIDHVSCLALAKVTEIQILNLAHNRLIELPSDAIKHFPNLTELNLSENELDFVPESLGFAANSLQILDISDNPIIELDHSSFEGMENIRRLFGKHLRELSIIRARAFAPLKQLKILVLSHSKKLDDIDEEAFEKLEKLEEVYLNDNALKTLSPNVLPWYQINILDIRNNEFICDCDLYNISRQITHILKTGIRMPLCLDIRRYVNLEIDTLTNETCSIRSMKGRRRIYTSTNFRIMRITLTTLIVILVVTSSIAIWLGYSKWRTYQRHLSYPFPAQVIYSPVSTTEFPRF